jgi:alanyl-tRNA synthetase
MQLREIRTKFLEYFHNKAHHVVKSSSLLPYNDPTLLFTNAGMNQFKDLFLGYKEEHYKKACSAQKCVRAGGKHNDLENVGFTARHHTFFEMLGNFSFGDYFKNDAIIYAWDFLTKELQIPVDKLYVTVYHTDDESYNIWHKKIGLDNSRIIRIGDKLTGGSDNFWQMGDTGPCGPCTEIFYDHGSHIKGGLPGSIDEDGDRYVEIWNCVFMQFNRDEQGQLHPLPKPSVDTGMGLERISAVMQGVHSNYEIDLFVKLIDKASLVTNTKDKNHPSLKVIADHIRAIAFLIADGVLPSNEGRGYVLRRIIRRAIRHGYKLGMRTPFLSNMLPPLIREMGADYKELVDNQTIIGDNLINEEEKFFLTIDNGMQLLQTNLDKLENTKMLSGDIVFKLYDTYGYPLDLTEDICREYNIKIDHAGFIKNMQQQKQLAKTASKFNQALNIDYLGADTEFSGYYNNSIGAKVVAIYNENNQVVESLKVGDKGIVILDNSCFYANSGGQVGDSGIITDNKGDQLLIEVTDTKYLKNKIIGHVVNIKLGMVTLGDNVLATLDLDRRQAIKRNHSVTHLLHKALQEVLGSHATQKGSLVNEYITRFDFAHNKALTVKELEKIEAIVNHVIMQNYQVMIQDMAYDEAIKSGVTALFGEKYGDTVRVITMGDFSVELCGGTHVDRTGDIGFFTITSESGIANGVRRIEAITGEVSLDRMQKNCNVLDNLRSVLKSVSNDDIVDKLQLLVNNNKNLIKDIDILKQKLANYEADQYLSLIKNHANGIGSLVIKLESSDNKTILNLIDSLKSKVTTTVIMISNVKEDKFNIVIAVTKDLLEHLSANELIKTIHSIGNGKGGGRPELANFAGVGISELDKALELLETVITKIVFK